MTCIEHIEEAKRIARKTARAERRKANWQLYKWANGGLGLLDQPEAWVLVKAAFDAERRAARQVAA